MLKANYHMHTTFCDGKNTPAEMAEAAFRQGFAHIGFSGHIDGCVGMRDVAGYRAQLARLRDAYAGRMEILCGCELDQDYPPCDTSWAEYVIGSTHMLRADDPRCIDESQAVTEALCRDLFGGDPYRMSAFYFRHEAEVVSRTHCTFIGHFDLIARFNDRLGWYDEESPRYLVPALEAMEALCRQGVPFEINCGAFNRARKKDFYPCTAMLKALRSFGGEILINSDAHDTAHIGAGFAEAVKHAAACGFTHTNILVRGADGKAAFRQLALDRLTD